MGLDPGDERVLHVGSEGRIGSGQSGAPPEAAGTDPSEGHQRLWDDAAWRRWLDDIGLDWDGSAA
jgi:hypothetical protein